MNKILLPFFAILLLTACQKENPTEVLPENTTDASTEQSTLDNGSATSRGNKRDVCHNGNIINISINAIPAHQAHGDAVDMDDDGYFDIDNPCSETDCDDNDASVNPGADEICDNEIDENCDGNVDEGCLVCPCFTADDLFQIDWFREGAELIYYKSLPDTARLRSQDNESWAFAYSHINTNDAAIFDEFDGTPPYQGCHGSSLEQFNACKNLVINHAENVLGLPSSGCDPCN